MNAAAEREPMAAAPVSVVVPVRDFGRGLRPFWDAWRSQLDRLGKRHEFVLVDDGSTDETGVAADGIACTSSDVVVVRHDMPQGLGAAMRAGFEKAQHPLVLLVVPEYAYRPSDLPALFGAIDGADLVAGVRPGRARIGWLLCSQRLMRLVARAVIGVTPGEPPAWYGSSHWRRRLGWRIVYGLRLQDPECGLKLFRRPVLERCPVQSAGRFALIELMAKANFLGALMAEVPLSKPGDLPVMKAPFEDRPTERRAMFRKPVFNLKPAPPPAAAE